MKTKLMFLAVFFLLCSGLRTAEAENVPEIFDQVKSSVTVVWAAHKVSSVTGIDLSKTLSIGSGVLISDNGEVMTAAHLVQTADEITVKLSNGKFVDAHVVSSVPFAGIALLQLESVPRDIPAARLGDSRKVQVGDEVFVVGSPYGLNHVPTVGHISGRHQQNIMLGGFETVEFFQTDAFINRGNSGGPMFNKDGEVIGIMSHILFTGSFERLGFAVTSTTAKRLLLDQKPYGLGFDGVLLPDKLSAAFDPPESMRVLVQQVAEIDRFQPCQNVSNSFRYRNLLFKGRGFKIEYARNEK